MFNVLSRQYFLRRKRFWRACMWSALAVVLLAAVARNQIAHVAIEHLGSFFLRNSVTVQHVRIGFKTVEITGFEVKEKLLADAPQLEIRSLCAAPTIWRGLRHGVWLQYVVIQEPTLHLRFDREGNLLSRFPPSSGGDTPQTLQLPFDRAVVVDGALVIHQEGKPVFSVRGASLTATADQSIQIRAEIADLLGARLHIESQVDQSTLGGRTKVSLAPMHLDTTKLARLPLVSNRLADHPVQGTLCARLQIEHPASDFDLRKQVIDFRARVSDVVSARYGHVTNGIDLRLFQREGCSSLVVEGPIAEGALQLNAHLNLAEHVPEFTATFKLAGINLEPIARMFAPDLPVAAIAAAEGRGDASWKDGVLTFRAALAPNLTGIQADGIPVGDLTTTITCDGSFDPHGEQSLAGSLRIDAASEGVELKAVARRFAMRSAEGQIGFRGSGIIPLEAVTDLQTYNASITVHSTPLTCEGLTIRPLSLDARLRNGTLHVTLPEATLAVANATARSSDCLVDRLQLAETLQVQTRLESSAPIARLLQPDSWMAAAIVAVRGLTIAREPISDFTATCQLTAGSLDLSPCNIRWRDSVCNLAGSGNLHDDGRVTVRFTAGPVPLRDVADVTSRFSDRPLPVSGRAYATGIIDVDLRQPGFVAGGELTLANTQYESTRIGDAQLLWEADPKAVRLRSVSDDFFGGSYVIDATLQSLDWTRTTVTASGQNIQLKRLASVAGNQLTVSGFVDGGLRFSSIGDLDSLRADGWLSTRGASIAGAPIQLRTTELRLADGLATVEVRGSAFDGSLTLEARSKLAELMAWIQHEPRQIQRLPAFGRVQAKDVAVKRLLAAFDKKRSLTPLNGSANLACVRDRATAQKGLLGTVDCSLENLRWNQSLMSRRLRATGVLYPTQLRVNNIDGRFADGTMSGEAKLNLTRVPSGAFRFNAERVNLRRALAPVPGISRSVTGAASVSISGRLGSLSTVTARVHASNLELGDLVIRELRLPIECSFQTQTARVRWKCPGGSINLGGGSVTVSSEGSLTNGLATMATGVSIRHVDSAKLMRGKSFSVGIIDGYVNVQAKRARAAKDLTGRFRLELSQIQSLELPGSESFMQLVKLPTIPGPTIDQRDGGIIEGRMAGGLLRLDNVALSKSGLLVLMDGTSTLDGRLDFDVVAITRQSGPADSLLALADSPLMLAASAPVALLAKANEAMKDRVIHIHVGGTGARPTLRLQPAKNLSQDVLRFFVASTLGSPVADIAIRKQKRSLR